MNEKEKPKLGRLNARYKRQDKAIWKNRKG